MASTQGTATTWQPPSDDELTWFKPGGRLPTHPTPLQYSFHIQAFTFGLSRALESLYLPLYEVRPRLINGELYLASVPSEMAERELDEQLGRMRDSGIRFTRSVRGIWERLIKKETEEYNDRITAFAPPSASDREVADTLLQLRRARANQWFAASRAIFAPTVMLQHGIGGSSIDEAMAVSEEALALIGLRGGELIDAALHRVGERLARDGRLADPADIQWLDQLEVRDALVGGQPGAEVAATRKAQAASTSSVSGPDSVGPALPSNAPRMYLLREIITLIA
jgi:hypothetical protein